MEEEEGGGGARDECRCTEKAKEEDGINMDGEDQGWVLGKR